MSKLALERIAENKRTKAVYLILVAAILLSYPLILKRLCLVKELEVLENMKVE